MSSFFLSVRDPKTLLSHFELINHSLKWIEVEIICGIQ